MAEAERRGVIADLSAIQREQGSRDGPDLRARGVFRELRSAELHSVPETPLCVNMHE